jgi:rhodanese-related sulfurtransferase
VRFQRLGPGDLEAALAAEPRPFVLDVRPPEEFAKSHLPGAVNVPVHDLGRRRRDLPASRVARIVVVGAPGRRTEAAANFLCLMGFADVAVARADPDPR